MTIFDYKAKNSAGATVVGTVDAADERGAADAIRAMGHLPMSITAAKKTAQPKANAPQGNIIARYLLYPVWTGVNIKMLSIFFRQLSTLLASGMSIAEALRSISTRMRNRLGTIADEARNDVSGGGKFSDSLSRYPHVFGRLQIALITSGERAGQLDTMADRIAQSLEYEIKVRGLIAKALFYPVLVLIFATLVSLIIPYASVLVNDGFATFFGLVKPTLIHWALWVGALVISIKLIFQFSIPRLIWDAIKVNIPIVGANAHKVAMSRFSRSMAILYAAGLSMSESVDIAADTCANLFVARGLKRAIPAIQSGAGLTDSLSKTKAVSPIVLDMISVGERSGSADTVLEKVADYMDEEVDASIHKMGIAIYVLMILVAAGLVGSIAAKFFLGYFESLLGAARQ